MLSILGAIPVIGSLVTSITSAVFDAKVRITQAKVGGDRDVAVAIVKAAETEQQTSAARFASMASNKLLVLLVIAFALPLVIYEWQVIVVDKIILHGAGKTDPIKGQVADWANTIIYSIFGAPTALALGKMWFANRSRG